VRCATCPRRNEERGTSFDDPSGKWCGTAGPIDATLAIVGIGPGFRELIDEEGLGPQPFVGGSGALTRAALGAFGVNLSDCFKVNCINCYPMGGGDEPTPEQLTACRARLHKDLASLTNVKTLLLFGNEPLRAITGFSGKKMSVSHWDGYLIRPDEVERSHRGNLPSSVEWILTTYHPAFIMRTGNKKFPWFRRAVGRAARASRDELSIVRPPRQNSDPGSLSLSPAASIDLENPRGPIERIGIAWRNAQGGVEAISERMGGRIAHLSQMALDRPEVLVFNANYDLPLLRKAGFTIDATTITDPMWGAAIADPDAPGYSLNQVFGHFCDGHRWKHEGNPGSAPREPKWTKGKTKKGQPCDKCNKLVHEWTREEKARWCKRCFVPKHEARVLVNEKAQETYNRQDASNLFPLWDVLRREIIATGQWEVWERERRVLPLLIDIHMRGLKIDATVRDRLQAIYRKWADRAEARWTSAGGCNPRSPAQLKKLLYEEWGLPTQYKEVKEGGQKILKITTEKEAIQNLIALVRHGESKRANGAPKLDSLLTSDDRISALMALLHTKHRNKYLATYLSCGDHIYPTYAPGSKDDSEGSAKFQVSAATGRIVAKGHRPTKTPPIQQMPKPLRVIVVPRPGFLFVMADYDSQELRIMAFKSGDPTLMEQIRQQDDHPGDPLYSIHTINATKLGIDRTRAKNCFYGWIFGGGWKTIHKAFHDAGFIHVKADEVKAMIEGFEKLYPGVTAYQRECIRYVLKHGYIVNGWGRKRWFGDVKGNRNEIINTPIQGSGADMQWDVAPQIEAAAVELGGHLVIPMHDEDVVEVPEQNASLMAWRMREIMEQEFPQVAPGFRCPVQIKIGSRWRLRKDAIWLPDEMRGHDPLRGILTRTMPGSAAAA